MKSLLLAAVLLFAQSEVQNAVILSIKYQNFKGISADEVAHRLKDRGVRMNVEQFYEPQQVESARQVLQELLEEKGRTGLEVKSDVRQIPPHSVEVTFRAVKN
jgi:outer membrane protein assembly factor BamA